MSEIQESIARIREMFDDINKTLNELDAAISAAQAAISKDWLEMQASARRSMKGYEDLQIKKKKTNRQVER